MIKDLIEKYQNTHTKLLNEYSTYTKTSEFEQLVLRSEMKRVVDIIDDLKQLQLQVENVFSRMAEREQFLKNYDHHPDESFKATERLGELCIWRNDLYATLNVI